MKSLKILVIPHAAATKIKTRSGELARALSFLGHEVDVFFQELQPKGISPFGKLIWHMRQMINFRRRKLTSNLYEISFPRWERGSSTIRNVVRKSVARLIRQQRYDLIVSAAYGSIEPPPDSKAKYFYDFVDDHVWAVKNDEGVEAAKTVGEYMARQLKKADQILVSSLTLLEKVEMEYKRKAHYVPNGANIKEMNSILSNKPDGKSVVGYIGSLDNWVKIDLLIEACQILKQKRNDLELVIVGEMKEGIAFPPWVKSIGFVEPQEIPHHLKKISVGVVPFEVTPFTDMALPLKVIEYGAAKKITVSTPLKELKYQSFPWVKLAEPTAQDFSEKIEEALNEDWLEEWDPVVDRFNWEEGAKTVLNLFVHTLKGE